MEAVIETFRPVKEYEGLYEVSDYGAVRSLKFGKVRYLKPEKMRDGYERIYLCRDGKQKRFMVHRLVWEAFVGKIPDGYEIDHINTIRDDNRLSNLRVVTRKGNMANPISVENRRDSMRRMSQDPKWREANREALNKMRADPQWIEAHREGIRKACAKPILQLDKQTGEVIRCWECAADASRELGINNGKISECCHGKRNSAGGFKWCFTQTEQ